MHSNWFRSRAWREGSWKDDSLNSVDDTSLSNDIGLDDSGVVDHDHTIHVHDLDLVTGKSHELNTSSINDHLGGEDTRNNMPGKHTGKSSLVKSGDSVGNGSESSIGWAEDGCCR